MRGIALFNLKLSGALGVKAEEAGGEQNTVLEVTLDLCLDTITDESFLLLVGNCDTAKLTRTKLINAVAELS